VEFRILGPLEAVDGDQPIPLGGMKQRSVLALLLLARGRPVATSRLIDEIWEGRPPETAQKSIQGYVSSLRAALGAGRVQTLERAYALRLEPGELDVERFEELVRSAGGAPPGEAAERLRKAFGIVRGEPLEDLRREPWSERESAHLDELVRGAVEARIDAELALGEHRRLVPELERLVAEHPYREHLLEQMMIALYRSGRQADALDAYRRGTARLRGELGLEPGRQLHALEQAILNQDPALEPSRLAVTRRAALRRRLGWKLIATGGAVLAAAAGAAAGLLAIGGGVSFEKLKPSIVLLDMQKQKVIAQWPYRDFQYPWVTTGNGHFWLASITAPGTEIDPRTGRFLRRFFPPLATGTNLALPRGRSIWFTTVAGLIRYDLGVDQETARYRIVRGTHRFGLNGIAYGAGSIWVTSPEENEVIRVNPATGAVLARIPVRTPFWLSYGNGGLWTTSDVDGVERIDPATNTVAAIAPVPEPIDEVVVGGGFAWATNPPKGSVYKMDRSGRIVATYETGDGAREPSYSDGKLWVSNGSAGTLTSIDAATGGEHTYRFGHPLLTEAAIGRYVLVAITEGLTVEEQLAKLHGPIAKLIVPIFQFDPPDPPLNSNPFVFELERATCAGLLRFSETNGTLEPELAAAMPTVSPDGRTYTFTVRRGLRFAPPSGAPVTTGAIRYSIERALSPKLGTPRPAAMYLRDLSGISVHGRRISFTLRARSPDFLERLSLPYYCTVPPDTPIVNGSTVHPIAPPSAGPYYMAARHNGDWTVLKRNPNYRGPRPARLDAIVLREGLDPERAVGKVEQGEWQGLALDDPLLAPGGAVARRFGAAGSIVYRALPEARLDYLALNSSRGPLRDAALRRRVAAALDRAALAVSRDLTPTASLLPPALRGGSIAAPPRLERQPAGKEPLTLTLAVQSDCGQPCSDFADLVSGALRPLRILVTTVASSNVSAAIQAPGTRVDMAAVTTELPYPDPASFLAQMLGHDVPAAWLPASTRAAVARLETLSGRDRDRAAVALAQRLERVDIPVVAYGTPQIGMLLRPQLGCRRWDAFDSELDLAALCLASS
jgi:DNA-binding SARP family transcriptional activator